MPTIDKARVTTAFELPGYRLKRNFGVVRGIVLVTLLTVGLEVGFIGLNGVDVNPLHIGTAQAQAAQAQGQATAGDFPPDRSIDCDRDKDGGTDFGESAECLFYDVRDWFSANQDLIFWSLAGLAVGVAQWRSRFRATITRGPNGCAHNTRWIRAK